MHYSLVAIMAAVALAKLVSLSASLLCQPELLTPVPQSIAQGLAQSQLNIDLHHRQSALLTEPEVERAWLTAKSATMFGPIQTCAWKGSGLQALAASSAAASDGGGGDLGLPTADCRLASLCPHCSGLEPVCADGVDFANPCAALCQGASVILPGRCSTPLLEDCSKELESSATEL